MRRVRVTRSMVTRRPDGGVVSYRHNGEYDIDDGQAADLVATGRAVYVDGGPARRRVGPTETKVEPEPEPEPEPEAEPDTEDTEDTAADEPAEAPQPAARPANTSTSSSTSTTTESDRPKRRGRPRLPRDEEGNIIRE